jgi:C-terminal processing protease CtpA/Prc
VKRLLALTLLSASQAIGTPLPPEEQARVARQAADLIEQRYVDPDQGRRIAKTLRSHQWAAPMEPESFATSMTSFLRETSRDGHFTFQYSATPISAAGGEEAFSAEAMERIYGAHRNHGVEKVERLEGNVMLLDLRVFPPPTMAGDVIAAAMTLVAQGDALIIDLRRNGGGTETSNLLMSYLLPPATELSGMYDRPTNLRTHVTTSNWVPGRVFGSEKPVYVLTSKRTFSAAEAVAYDLQAAKRATIVGEVTGGGANPFEYRRIDDHFALGLPEARSINPVTGTNWQGVGVKPDVAVPADQALDRALELAKAAIRGRSAAGSGLRSLP